MSIELNGQNLIFLISQPRAGSTLLQRMLQKHPKIHTSAEPWTMLHPAYGLRKTGHEADYNAQSAWLAVDEFIQQLPRQRESYLEGLRLMNTHLYNQILEGTGKSYFLDKTPRYYNIIPELSEIFPKAKFIILLRNPMAVACSIMDTWAKGNLFILQTKRADLLEAPSLLMEGIHVLGDRCLTVNYENLLADPDQELRRIIQYLELEFSPDLVHYHTLHPSQSDSEPGGSIQDLSDRSQQPANPEPSTLAQGADDGNSKAGNEGIGRKVLHNPSSKYRPDKGFGYKDQKDIFYHGKLDKENVNKWIRHLENAQHWRILNDYYQALGNETIRAMGVNPDQLKSLLDSYRPSQLKRSVTLSLNWVTKKPDERGSLPYEHYLIKLIRLFQRQGFWGGLLRGVQKTSGLDGFAGQSSSLADDRIKAG